MTEEERIEFIKNKIAPLFDGMNAKDVVEIVQNTYNLERAVMARFNLSLQPKKT